MKLRNGRTIGNEQSISDNIINIQDFIQTDKSGPISDKKVISPISSCGNCITCKNGYFKAEPCYSNKVTGEQFNVTDVMNCQTTGVVYLITCGVPDCPLQYVGQTVSSVNKRCIQHRSGLKTGNEPKFVRQHFTKVHQPSDLRITPVQKVTPDNTDPNFKRKSLVDNLRAEENRIILEINSLFPYGLNDRLEKPKYMDAEEQFLSGACIYKIFPKITSKRHKRGSKTKKKDNQSPIIVENVLIQLKEFYLSNNIHQCRTTISSLTVNKVTELGYLINDELNNAIGLEKFSLLMLKDMCNHFRTRNIDYKTFLDNYAVFLIC